MNKENNLAPIPVYCRKVISNSLPDLAGKGAASYFTNRDEVDNKKDYVSHKRYSFTSTFDRLTGSRFPLFGSLLRFFVRWFDEGREIIFSPFIRINQNNLTRLFVHNDAHFHTLNYTRNYTHNE